MSLCAENISLAGRLNGVSAGLKKGQITAICGPNGAGKSTLLSALAGLVLPDKGSVSIGGEPLSEIHPRARAKQIGYLPQNGEIAWDVSVRNLVELGRMPHGDSNHLAVDAAINALDLDAFANRPVLQLSGGEIARVLLARVLAGEPEWILADEPIAALDLSHQHSLIAHLRSVADHGAGVVIVLHDLALAMNYADRVLVLDDGLLAADDTPQAALDCSIIENVWGFKSQWIGVMGARAIVKST